MLLADQRDTVLVEAPRVQLVVAERTVAGVVAAGQQGPAGATGPAGPPGAAAVEIAFAYGDATPVALTTATAGKLVYGVDIHIRTAFDGSGAALTVGDAGDTSRLMAANENDPTAVGSYTTTPAYAYGSDTGLTLSITPGAGASQGAGVLVLYIQQ
jgi:hypothetical protein